MRQLKNISLVLGITLSVFFISFMVAAWTPPNQVPTLGNVALPINVGSGSQVKDGALSVLGVFETHGLTRLARGNYSSVVIVGTATTSSDLIVYGNVVASAPVDDSHLATKKYVDDKFDSSVGVLDACGGETSTVMYSQTYPIKAFGSNCWMTKNVNHPTGLGSTCYDGISSNCTTYGRLYDFNNSYLACGDGWRLPTLDDFIEVRNIIGYSNANWIDSDLWAGELAGSWRTSPSPAFSSLDYIGFYRMAGTSMLWRISSIDQDVMYSGGWDDVWPSVRCVKK